jgi:hypothetical protein
VFADLEDPRTGNAQRYDLLEILLIALCTVLCGGETCADMARFGHAKRDFLQEFLTLEHGIPSHDTFSRVFRRLDPIQFQACFLSVWWRNVVGTGCGGRLRNTPGASSGRAGRPHGEGGPDAVHSSASPHDPGGAPRDRRFA